MAQPAQIRATARTDAGPNAFETPTKKSDIDRFFENLNHQDGLVLPYNDRTSPSKRRKSPGHEIVSRVNLLYFQNQEGLVDAIALFRLQSPDLKTNDDKLDCLLEELNVAAESCKPVRLRTPNSKLQRTPRSRNRWPPRSIGTSNPEPRQALSAPPSPSLSVKHAPKSCLAEAEDIELPPTMPRYGVRPDSNTSNASFATANTSFSIDVGGMDNSFWSNAPNNSQDPPSPATSVGSFVMLDEPDASSRQAYGSFPWSQIERFDKQNVEQPLTRPAGVVSESIIQPPQACKPSERLLSSGDNVMPPPAHIYQRVNRGPPQVTSPTTTRSTCTKSSIPPGDAAKLLVPEHHRVKRISEDGISRIQLPSQLLQLPLSLRVECQRFCEASKISATDLTAQWPEPRTAESLHVLAEEFKVPLRRTAESEPMALFTEIQWSNSSSGDVPVLQLRMLPPRRNESNAYQRKFGAHRFLYADLPSLTKVPDCMDLGGQGRCIETRFRQLLQRELEFLGCRWRCYLVRPKKKARKLGRDSSSKKVAAAFQLHFFAVSGQKHDFSSMSIVDVVDWAVPLRENFEKTHCKAYARLDLQASTTEPAFQFHPNDIEYDVPDIYAKGEPSDTGFDDPNLDHPDLFDEKRKVAMNDGQCYIDPWVVRQIQSHKGLAFPPSTIQARLFGAKGMWAVKPGLVPACKPSGHLIGISHSQIKAKQKARNLTNDFDPENTTFNILDITLNAHPSVLYPDFLPILLDRGVSQEKVKGLVRTQIKREVGNFLEAISCRHKLRQWINSVNHLREVRDREVGIETLADFPISRTERIIRMLESGFEPMENRYLANETIELAKKHFEFATKVFRVQIPQSTMVRGIADPCSCLEPREVHLNFSSTFEDLEAGRRWIDLHGMDALIARNPALRRSDIQKWRVVYKPELAHLPDTVIFSARGKRPGASLLQGGDYDGDMFWVCWQPEVVDQFKNATAPWESQLPSPESLGIEVDRETLGTYIGIKEGGGPASSIDENGVLKWIHKNIENRMARDLLGVVTLAHGKVVYHERDLNSVKAEALVNLHDHLVDADKRGYRFDEEAWRHFKAKYKILDYPVPAYRSLLEDDDDDQAQAKNTVKAVPKQDNIIDFIHFFIVKKEIDKGLKAAETALTDAGNYDPHLVKLFDEVSTAATQDAIVRNELDAMKDQLAQMASEWSTWTSRRAELKSKRVALKDELDWDEMVFKILARYQDILPTNLTHPRIDEWMQRIGTAPNKWELLKASALAKIHPGKIQLIYKIAGDDLCRLKARESSEQHRSVEMRQDSYLDLKVKKPKRERHELEAFDDCDDEYGYDAEAFDALLGAEQDRSKLAEM